MKRSRVFLGFTTACLAVAGAVAAKAYAHKQHGWYYTRIISVAGQPTPQCTKLILTGCQYNAAGAFICTVGDFFNSKLYTQKGIAFNRCTSEFAYNTIDN